MKTVALSISYDGTDFSGWQRQNGRRTVQGEIESALKKICKEDVALVGSGRTDAGVHAKGQAASFLSPIDSMQAKQFVPALNSILSRDVRIMSACEKPAGFHARFSATSRTYRYFLSPFALDAQESRFAWEIFFLPDLKLLNEMAALLRGELDFSSFASGLQEGESPMRFVENASFFAERGKIVFEITANAFLWKMIRSIVGTAVDLARKGADSAALKKILDARDRRAAGQTAPPRGLFLWRVDFSGKRRK